MYFAAGLDNLASQPAKIIPDTLRKEALNRARILIADDHAPFREIIRSRLKMDFEVVQAVENGKMLLEAESEHKPDVCLLDVSMPVLNGIETALQLRQRGCTAKLILLTIIEDPDYVQAALESGASGFVIKHNLDADLYTAIKEVIAGRTFISPAISLAHFKRVKVR